MPYYVTLPHKDVARVHSTHPNKEAAIEMALKVWERLNEERSPSSVAVSTQPNATGTFVWVKSARGEISITKCHIAPTAESLCFRHEDDGLLCFDPVPWLEHETRFILLTLSGGIDNNDMSFALSPHQVYALRDWLNNLPPAD